MSKYEFMERFEEKLRDKAERSAESLKEQLAKNIEKDKQKVAKDLYNIYTNTGNGAPPNEMGHIFKHRGDGGGIYLGSDEE